VNLRTIAVMDAKDQKEERGPLSDCVVPGENGGETTRYPLVVRSVANGAPEGKKEGGGEPACQIVSKRITAAFLFPLDRGRRGG